MVHVRCKNSREMYSDCESFFVNDDKSSLICIWNFAFLKILWSTVCIAFRWTFCCYTIPIFNGSSYQYMLALYIENSECYWIFFVHHFHAIFTFFCWKSLLWYAMVPFHSIFHKKVFFFFFWYEKWMKILL